MAKEGRGVVAVFCCLLLPVGNEGRGSTKKKSTTTKGEEKERKGSEVGEKKKKRVIKIEE